MALIEVFRAKKS